MPTVLERAANGSEEAEAAEEPVAEKEKADVVEAAPAVASTASPPAAAEPVAEEPVEEKIAKAAPSHEPPAAEEPPAEEEKEPEPGFPLGAGPDTQYADHGKQNRNLLPTVVRAARKIGEEDHVSLGTTRPAGGTFVRPSYGGFTGYEEVDVGAMVSSGLRRSDHP